MLFSRRVNVAGERVYLADAVDLIAEKLHPDGAVLPVRGPQLHRVAADAEHVALKGDVVALIADLDEPPQKLVPLQLRAHPEADHHFFKVLRLAQAVDAADRGHHDDVPPLQQRGGGRQAQTVDLVVYGAVLFDVGVRVGDIRLRLIVVVVGHEILHGVFGEKLLELAAQLGGQRLVVGQHQRGLLHPLDDLGHGVGLAGASDAQQRLLVQPRLHAPGQGVYRLRLVAGGSVFAHYLEISHFTLRYILV
jgi:hypothetical protein